MNFEKLSVKYALQLMQPHTWAASLIPAFFGILYSIYIGEEMPFFLAFILIAICLLLHSCVNTLNEYFDYIKGTDSKEDNVEENDSVLVYHKIHPTKILALAFALLGMAAILGILVILYAGIAPLIIGMIGGLVVLLYSGGPLPLSYLPVGELFSGLIMGGFIPLGIVAAASGRIRFGTIISALPLIIGIALIMMSNNTCDIEKDKVAKRFTLPILLGRDRTKILFRVIVTGWILMIIIFPLLMWGWLGIIAPILLFIGRKPFFFLMHSPLTHEVRIQQMKMILLANIVGNGTYILTLLVALLTSSI